MRHRVKLSNGRALLLEEGDNRLSIASEQEGFEGEVEYYICEIEGDGVLVMPNSGDAGADLVHGLPRRGSTTSGTSTQSSTDDPRIKSLKDDLRCVLGLIDDEQLLSIHPDGSALIKRQSGQVARVTPSSVREVHMEERILQLETALGFYANPEIYHRKPPDGDSEIGDDAGETARKALGREEKD